MTYNASDRGVKCGLDVMIYKQKTIKHRDKQIILKIIRMKWLHSNFS